MGWLKAAVAVGVLGGALGAVLASRSDTSDGTGVVIVVAVIGALLGLVLHALSRSDDLEDAKLDVAARNPPSDERSSEWTARLRAGEHVRVGRFVTLTREGVEWTGLRTRSVPWRSVDSVAPWSYSTMGMRSARAVRLRVHGTQRAIRCSKGNFAAVLATCVSMTDPPRW